MSDSNCRQLYKRCLSLFAAHLLETMLVSSSEPWLSFSPSLNKHLLCSRAGSDPLTRPSLRGPSWPASPQWFYGHINPWVAADGHPCARSVTCGCAHAALASHIWWRGPPPGGSVKLIRRKIRDNKWLYHTFKDGFLGWYVSKWRCPVPSAACAPRTLVWVQIHGLLLLLLLMTQPSAV